MAGEGTILMSEWPERAPDNIEQLILILNEDNFNFPAIRDYKEELQKLQQITISRRMGQETIEKITGSCMRITDIILGVLKEKGNINYILDKFIEKQESNIKILKQGIIDKLDNVKNEFKGELKKESQYSKQKLDETTRSLHLVHTSIDTQSNQVKGIKRELNELMVKVQRVHHESLETNSKILRLEEANEQIEQIGKQIKILNEQLIQYKKNQEQFIGLYKKTNEIKDEVKFKKKWNPSVIISSDVSHGDTWKEHYVDLMQVLEIDKKLNIKESICTKSDELIIRTQTQEDLEKLKQILEEYKEEENFKYREIERFKPKLIIYNLGKDINNDIIIKGIGENENRDIKVLFNIENKKQDKKHVVIMVDPKIYREKTKQNEIEIDNKRYKIKKIIGVKRCTKCTEIGHTARNCESGMRCIKCGHKEHTGLCSKRASCINCRKAKDSEDIMEDTAHSPWSRNCPSIRRVEKFLEYHTDYGDI